MKKRLGASEELHHSSIFRTVNSTVGSAGPLGSHGGARAPSPTLDEPATIGANESATSRRGNTQINRLYKSNISDMKIGVVLSAKEPELAWNAFRYGVKAIENKHSVRFFLLAQGVEVEEIRDSKFDVKKMMQEFLDKGGTILACGTCLNNRKKDATELGSISTMQDMVDLTVDSDRVVTFG